MPTVWKIAPGNGACVWDDCRERKCISINWLNQTDYSEFESKKEIAKALIKAKEGKGGGGADSIWPFVKDVRRGHVIVANEGRSRVKGIGIVRSEYLAPDHQHNPNCNQDYHRHVRRVEWLITDTVDLGEAIFNIPTVQRLQPPHVAKITRAYLRKSLASRRILTALFSDAAKDFRMSPGADEADAQDDREYLPRGGDCREKAWAQIFRRRGQGPFRDGLLRRYGSQCLVTGCTVLAILEAAHIDPYREDMHNHLGNGLLLRADIHTLFDLDLLVIEPTDLRIILHPDVAEHYKDIVADRLLVSGEQRPLIEALRRRYEQFKKDRDWDK